MGRHPPEALRDDLQHEELVEHGPVRSFYCLPDPILYLRWGVHGLRPPHLAVAGSEHFLWHSKYISFPLVPVYRRAEPPEVHVYGPGGGAKGRHATPARR